MGIPRNAVLQRMRRAEKRMGRPAKIKIAELHAALVVCEVLGPRCCASKFGRAAMCLQHTGEGWEDLVERQGPFICL
ncbi:hypothetical protein [Rhodococcus erythropolis]|uniref:hypothetical protein n=1 Tax=Rhodococcus erythropolis TaxID=1833 RepID=UPI002168DC4C|nr:hypothetical protein [Rhodococcus erythropolis]